MKLGPRPWARGPRPFAAVIVSITCLIVMISGTARATGSELHPRAPGPGPRAFDEDTLTLSYDVGGVRVVQRRSTASDVVAVNVYLLGGTRQVTAQTAGIEPLLLAASEHGTRGYSRSALREMMARTGSRIVIEPEVDWTMFGFRALRSEFDSTWAVFADRLMRPRLDSADVELERGQILSAIRTRREDPDELVELLADSLTFAGTPYALPPGGTVASLTSLRLADLRRYLAEQLVTSRLLVVVVGNVERPRVERAVRATLARLPKGSYVWTPPPVPDTTSGRAVLVDRSLPTNYILGYYVGPPAASADLPALRVAASVLGGRLFTEIRSRRNLSYAVDAPLLERGRAAGGLYVTTVAPEQSLGIMRQEIASLQTDLIPAAGLEQLVQQFITNYFLENETNAEQATFLAKAQIYRGDYRLAESFMSELRAVTPDDVRRVARTYMKGMRFAYVGDTTRVSRATLRRF